MIKRLGQEMFEKACLDDPEWEETKFIPIPKGFIWLFNHFYQIWQNCETDMMGNKIFKPRDILDYSECTGVTFTVYERKLILKMKQWAFSSIFLLKKKKEKD